MTAELVFVILYEANFCGSDLYWVITAPFSLLIVAAHVVSLETNHPDL